MMKVVRSAYYAYAGRKTFRQNGDDVRIKECFDLNCRRYGSRRIAANLKLGRSTVQKVMRQKNLRAIQPRSFRPQTTDSKHGLPVCANLLQDGANTPIGKSEVFVGDITYLRLRNGSFCYLACLQDKFTRRIASVESSGANDSTACH